MTHLLTPFCGFCQHLSPCYRSYCCCFCCNDCVVCTMVIYIIFFRIIYKHDNNENLKRFLEPDVIRGRNQRNGITFFGQFCSFVLQMITVIFYMIQVAFKTSENQLFDIFLMIRTTLFAGMAIIEVLTSKNLRSQLVRKTA